ncbi:hypothetical protein FACS1894201_01660 [Bacteroidia bacterium]|nr:hypothetical protein FACS1894201_01660 [Bacteroidia bacterium]
MKHFNYTVIVAVILSFIILPACRNKDYDLKKIDMTVHLGGDSLFIPIGSTDTIRLGELLDTGVVDVLTLLDDGSYGFRLGNSLSIDIPTLDTNALRIDDVVWAQSHGFSMFANGLYDGLVIPGFSLEQIIPMNIASGDFNTLAIPPIIASTTFPIGLTSVPKPPFPIVVPIPTLTANIDKSSPVNISTTLPSQIKKINNVILAANSAVEIILSKENFPSGIQVNVDMLQIVFPPQFSLAPGANVSGSTYTLENYSFVNDMLTIKIEIAGIDLSSTEPVNQVLSLSEQIQVTGRYSVSGTINSNELPTNVAEDAKIRLVQRSDLTVESLEVHINQIEYNLPSVNEPIYLTAPLDASIDSIHRITVSGTMLSLQLQIPTLSPSTPITTNANGIKIQFPKLFKFANVAGLDQVTNIYTIQGAIPNIIQLELEYLEVNEAVNALGMLEIRDTIAISGGVQISEGTINSTQLNGLSSQKIGVIAQLSDIRITEFSLGGISAMYADSTVLEYAFDELPPEIKSLDSIMFSNSGAEIELRIEFDQTIFGGKNLQGSLIVDLPDLIMFGEDASIQAGNVLKENIILTNNVWQKTLVIRGFRFDNSLVNGELKIEEKVKAEAFFQIIDPTISISALVGQQIQIDLYAAIKHIHFDRIYGRVSPNIEPQRFTFAIDGLPDMLTQGGTMLSLSDPHLSLSSSSNLGIPLKADVEIIPWSGGTINESAHQKLSLVFKNAPDATVNQDNKFWISKSQDNVPSGYTFIGADLTQLFRKIPDSVQFILTPGVDENVQCIFEPYGSYYVDVDYEVGLPLSFDEDFYFSYGDTLDAIDSSMADLLFKGTQIGVYGEILNSIPMTLDFMITPLDENNVPIPIAFLTQKILAGGKNNTAVRSDLDMAFNDPDGLMRHVRKFAYKIMASMDGAPPAEPIRPENFVKVKLKAKVIGGIDYTL